MCILLPLEHRNLLPVCFIVCTLMLHISVHKGLLRHNIIKELVCKKVFVLL